MTDIEAVKMSDEEMTSAVRMATYMLTHPHPAPGFVDVSKALLSAHALIEKQRAVVDAAREWRRVGRWHSPSDDILQHFISASKDETDDGLADAVDQLDEKGTP